MTLSPGSPGEFARPGRPDPLGTTLHDPAMWLNSNLVVYIKEVPEMLMCTLQLPLPHSPSSAVLGVHPHAPLGQGVRTNIVLVVADRVPPNLGAPDSLTNVQMRLDPRNASKVSATR